MKPPMTSLLLLLYYVITISYYYFKALKSESVKSEQKVSKCQ